jgi:hypothetical protein
MRHSDDSALQRRGDEPWGTREFQQSQIRLRDEGELGDKSQHRIRQLEGRLRLLTALATTLLLGVIVLWATVISPSRVRLERHTSDVLSRKDHQLQTERSERERVRAALVAAQSRLATAERELDSARAALRARAPAKPPRVHGAPPPTISASHKVPCRAGDPLCYELDG